MRPPGFLEPVWHGEDPDYFTPDEYAGGYDNVNYFSAKAEYIKNELYYQGTSREYIEFLKE